MLENRPLRFIGINKIKYIDEGPAKNAGSFFVSSILSNSRGMAENNKTVGFPAELFTQRMQGNWKSALLEINYRKGMF